LPAHASLPQTVTLAWDQEADPSVAGYRVYFGTSSGDYSRRIDVGNTPSAAIPNLTVGTTYYFVVTAYDASGLESAPSQEVSFTVSTFAGEYKGSITGTDAADSGTIDLYITTTGAFTGTVSYGGGTSRLNGIFNTTGIAEAIISRGNAPALQMVLNMNPSISGYTITGTVDNGTSVSQFEADALPFSKTNPAPYAGQYTVLIQSGTSASGTPIPSGAAAATLTVAATGDMIFAGILADGTPFSQRATLSVGGVWNLFLPLYGKNGGMIEGRIQFENIDGVSDLDGAVAWVKQANPRASSYPAGFTANAPLIGSAYSPAGNLVISPVTSGIFQANGANITDPINETAAVISASPTALKAAGLFALSLNISRATGLVTGSFVNPDTGAKTSLNAVVFQKQGIAQGNFESREPGGNLAGSIQLTPE